MSFHVECKTERYFFIGKWRTKLHSATFATKGQAENWLKEVKGDERHNPKVISSRIVESTEEAAFEFMFRD